MKTINSLKDVDINTAEGLMLNHTLGWLMTMEGNTDKTVEEIIAKLNTIQHIK